MKKFSFPLDTVLHYKEQILESLRGEHARILIKVRKCEDEIEDLERRRLLCIRELSENRTRGMAIHDIRTYENYLEALRLKILAKQRELAKLQEERRFTELMMEQEELKTYPFGDVWDYFCQMNQVPVKEQWFKEVRAYEKEVLLKRG